MVMKMKKQSILKRTELYWYNGTAYYTSQFVFRVHFLIITKTCVLVLEQKRNRIAVLEEQKKRIQQAMGLKPAPSEHNLELKAMKSMGAMEEGDAVLGSGAEANLDSQVCDIIGLSYLKKEKSKRNNPCQIIFSFFAKHIKCGGIAGRCTGGMTSTDLGSQSTSTMFILDMSGTNTIKLTMIMTNSIFSTQTWWTRRRLQFIPLRRMGAVGRLA